jgi:hypothetical protein
VDTTERVRLFGTFLAGPRGYAMHFVSHFLVHLCRNDFGGDFAIAVYSRGEKVC